MSLLAETETLQDTSWDLAEVDGDLGFGRRELLLPEHYRSGKLFTLDRIVSELLGQELQVLKALVAASLPTSGVLSLVLIAAVQPDILPEPVVDQTHAVGLQFLGIGQFLAVAFGVLELDLAGLESGHDYLDYRGGLILAE